MLEVAKWLVVFILFAISVIGNYLCSSYSFFLRNLFFIFMMSIAIYVASITKAGKLALIFGKDSIVELRKVVWPKFKDSIQTTLIVIIVTVFVSLILWGLDSILVRLVSFGLRL